MLSMNMDKMMELRMKLFIRTIVLLCMLCSIINLSSCNAFSNPPSFEWVDKFVKDHIDDIESVTDYLMNSEFHEIYIEESFEESNISIFADLEYLAIEDQEVKNSLSSLFNSGCLLIAKVVPNNAIIFRVWFRDLFGGECGFVCAIDSSMQPSVDYQTCILPLNDSKWYYYTADFEEWRITHH